MNGKTYAAIVHYMNWPSVLDTISDCLAEGIPEEFVILVDNGSPDGALGALTLLHPHIQIVQSEQGNIGYGAGVNLGVKHARDQGADRVLVLTHEVRTRRGLLNALSAALDIDPSVAVSAPLTYLKSDPEVVWSAGGDLSLRDCYPVARKEWSASPVDWVDGCCFLVRVRDHFNIGGMFEPYFLYLEEVDYFVRMRRSGRGVVLLAEAVAYQEPGSMGLYYAIRNRILLARRLSRRSLAVRIAIEHGAKGVWSWFIRDLRPSGRDRIRAVRDGWRLGVADETELRDRR
ncbi:glycosyltransferase [Nocardioides sp. LS1]|uniref:glycosyltransferase n=1 Tax=Nocardioides sp. LS1 TaxID=1027620 RepID=UPI000FFAEEAB|nr:glycosyltransferase family 2 protein [Nocardioides sp. LS1]GCD90658.1 hypothetical protein NLS1_26640 [Nocardioides sp. LS1]